MKQMTVAAALSVGLAFSSAVILARCNGSSGASPGGPAPINAPAGNVYVAESSNPAIAELLAPAYTAKRSLGSGFCNPQRIAVDGSGNVFVPDVCANRVKEIVASGGYATVKVLGSGYPFNSPVGVAVDSADNVFVIDDNGYETGFHEILATGGYVQVQTFGSGFSYPGAIAVDGPDNVFVADSDNRLVKEVVAAIRCERG